MTQALELWLTNLLGLYHRSADIWTLVGKIRSKIPPDCRSRDIFFIWFDGGLGP